MTRGEYATTAICRAGSIGVGAGIPSFVDSFWKAPSGTAPVQSSVSIFLSESTMKVGLPVKPSSYGPEKCAAGCGL